MGILKNQIGSRHGLKGETPDVRGGALKTSTLHFQSSINDSPDIEQKPSNLDLDGKKPAAGTYRDNAPEGASF